MFIYIYKCHIYIYEWLTKWLSGKESACQCRRNKRLCFDPRVGKICWSRKWQPTPVFLPGKFHRQRSLTGHHTWGCKESDTTEPTCASMFTRTSCRTFMRTRFISCGKIPISDSSIKFLCLISLALKISINLLPSVKFCLPFNFTSVKTSSKPSPSWFLISCPAFLYFTYVLPWK